MTCVSNWSGHVESNPAAENCPCKQTGARLIDLLWNRSCDAMKSVIKLSTFWSTMPAIQDGAAVAGTTRILSVAGNDLVLGDHL